MTPPYTPEQVEREARYLDQFTAESAITCRAMLRAYAETLRREQAEKEGFAGLPHEQQGFAGQPYSQQANIRKPE